MHILYLDDSGSAANRNESYFVLAGVSVFEAQVNWFTERLDQIAEGINPGNPSSVEFHASEIFSRRSAPWRDLSKQEAIGVIRSVLQVVADSYDTARVFTCAVEKSALAETVDPVELAFEDLTNRFDLFLSRLHQSGDRQRGQFVLDKTTRETSLQRLARDFRRLGTQWRSIRHLADTPFFVDSSASRMVQIADHVAYAVFRRYNASDTQYFDILASKFDQVDGIFHGLAHKTQSQDCLCPPCVSRRTARLTRRDLTE